MEKEKINIQVKEIVSEQLGVDLSDITDRSSFVDDLGADSLDTVELVMAIEDAFSIEIPDEDAENIKSLDQVVEYIENKLKTPAA